MSRFLLAVALVFLIQSAPRETSAQGRSENNYLIGGRATSVTFVDANSIKIEGNKRTYWSTIHFRETTETGMSYAKSLNIADCANEMTATLYGAFYNESGSLIAGAPPKDLTEKPVIPGSVGDKIFQFVCASPAERLNMNVNKVDDTLKAAARWFEGR